MRRRIATISMGGGSLRAALGAGALALACVALMAPSAANAGARRGLDALVLKEAHSPVVQALKRRHGIDVHHGRHRAHSPKKFDMLIADGDELSARKLAHRRELKRFSRAHRPVLALDMEDNHFDRTIDKRTGLSISGPHGGHGSDAFYFHRGLIGSSPRTLIVEARDLRARHWKRLNHRRRAKLTRRQARRMSNVVHRDVASGNRGLRRAAPPQDASIPPELQHIGWTYSVVGHWVTDDGYWTDGYIRRSDRYIQVNQEDGGGQSANWTMNYNFDLYLDNDPSRPAAQHHQILTYNLDGQVAPKLANEDFFRMDDKFSAGLTPYLYNLERAWWTGVINVKADPDPATNQKLVWQASEPQSLNSEHEYSSGQDFTVGFSGSNEGAEVSASYGVHSEVSNSVPDWGVENQTSGNHLAWRFSSRSPCDPRGDHYDREQCFDKAEPNGTYWGPHRPNDLSTGQMQIHTSGRWNTKGGSSNVLTGSDAQLNLSVDTPVTLVDTYCSNFLLGVCPKGERQIGYQYLGPGPTQISIDASQVVPVGIDSLGLSPNPANGTAKQKVTGTVTLEKPAPRDTAIVIYSDNPNASVGGVSGRGSKTTITVPEGAATQSFDIRTNDNKLNPGQHTTAEITAFYQDPVTEQLTICAGSPPC